jgi:hypothetical protein
MASMPDPVQIDVPVRTPVEPTAPVDRPIDRPTRTFQVESRDGYRYSVTGKVICLDVAADDPFMVVLTDDRTGTRIQLGPDRERRPASAMAR